MVGATTRVAPTNSDGDDGVRAGLGATRGVAPTDCGRAATRRVIQALQPAVVWTQDGEQAHHCNGTGAESRVETHSGAVSEAGFDHGAVAPSVIAKVELGSCDSQLLV